MDFEFPGLRGLEDLFPENQTESTFIPKFNFSFSPFLPFSMMIPEDDTPSQTPKVNLSNFLDDLKVHISGEAEISGWLFWMMIFLYFIVASMGIIGNGLGKYPFQSKMTFLQDYERNERSEFACMKLRAVH